MTTTDYVSPAPDVVLEWRDRRKALYRALAGIRPRYAAVLDLRFGLSGPELTRTDSAKCMGISPSRVQQLEARAIRDLRKQLCAARHATFSRWTAGRCRWFPMSTAPRNGLSFVARDGATVHPTFFRRDGSWCFWDGRRAQPWNPTEWRPFERATV